MITGFETHDSSDMILLIFSAMPLDSSTIIFQLGWRDIVILSHYFIYLKFTCLFFITGSSSVHWKRDYIITGSSFSSNTIHLISSKSHLCSSILWIITLILLRLNKMHENFSFDYYLAVLLIQGSLEN